jgi:centromere/kinetochore protein ZW10
MDDFQSLIDSVDGFCQSLSSLGYSHIDALQQWVKNAPMTWLGRCRETALDEIRTSLAKGIGKSRPVEKIEKQMVSVAEGNELATTGAGATADTNDWGAEWGAEWDDDEEATSGHDSTNSVKDVKGDTTTVDEDDGADAWGWGDDEAQVADDRKTTTPGGDQAIRDEDDGGAAWGWGDEDETSHQPEPKVGPAKNKKRRISGAKEETRELVLKETYHISSLPDPVLQLIYRVLEDGAILTRGEEQYSHVANTAAGLFSLPTFCLALFRAISPHYYPVDEGGSM